MKIINTIALGCISFAAFAQEQPQQSPFQTPAVTTPATVGSPIILNLSGVTVTDVSGQPVGPIQHVLLSPAGCVDLAVLSLGGQKLVPVPWQLVRGSGATRGETAIASQATFVMNVDRATLQQAPSVTVNQLSLLHQPQMVQQVQTFFREHAGAPAGQTNILGGTVGVGVGVGGTNRLGVGVGIGITNDGRILSPTGPTNIVPGRPAFDTNRQPRPAAPQPPVIPPPGPNPNQPGQPIPREVPR